MVNTMIESKVAEFVPTNMASLVVKVPKVEENFYQVPVSASGVLREIANQLFQVIDQMAVKPLPVVASDFEDAFEYILAARCAYVSGVCRTDKHPREMEYPSLLFPILAHVGRYVDVASNVTIVPIPEIGYQDLLVQDGETTKGLPKFKLGKNKLMKEPVRYREVMSVLRSYGVATAFGLPMDKDVEVDDVYRLEEVDGAICGSKKEPSTHALYARALIQMHYLASLYGETRVHYLALSSLRAGIYDLVARQVRGPSIRVS